MQHWQWQLLQTDECEAAEHPLLPVTSSGTGLYWLEEPQCFWWTLLYQKPESTLFPQHSEDQFPRPHQQE
jgi:hypothetical protein